MIKNFSNILNDLEDFEIRTSEDYIKELEMELNESELLISNYRNNGLRGCFKDDLWVFEYNITKTYLKFNFNELEQFRFLSLSKENILRIKAYIAYLLIEEEVKPITAHGYFKSIKLFLKLSNGISEEYLTSINEIILEEIDNENFLAVDSYQVARFFKFLIKKLEVNEHIYVEYYNVLNELNSTLNRNMTSRELPNTKDIMIFHYYINKFFNDENIDKDLKLFYGPIHIWWKLTNVIPMRPSEFCVNLDRECVSAGESEGEYYLHINRVKEKFSNRFPILKDLNLNKDIAKLMLEYKEDTKKFGETKTFFSYKAIKALRKKVYFGCMENNDKQRKINENYFTLSDFSYLLEYFYLKIINGMYKTDSYSREILPGDTRHFAFFSLLMQGVSPVEIALLGGHSLLETQVNYQNGLEYYVGTELYDFLNGKKDETLNKSYEKLNDIINRLPKVCPKSIEERIPLNIGYCLCNFNIDTCDNVDDFCCFCTKWWAEPTKITYDKLKVQIQNEIESLEGNIFIKMNVLEELLSRKAIIKRPNMNIYAESKSTINEIRSSVNRFIGLKMATLTNEFTKLISKNQLIEGES